jgi:hypothetical protein
LHREADFTTSLVAVKGNKDEKSDVFHFSSLANTGSVCFGLSARLSYSVLNYLRLRKYDEVTV